MKKLLLTGLVLLLLLAAVIIINTVNFVPKTQDYAVAKTDYALNRDNIAQHMSQAIKFATISHQDPSQADMQPFDDFIAWAQQTYPLVHDKFEIQRLGGYSLLMKWQGSNDALQPILLTGHYDVVPVIPGTEKLWQQPPWAGNISEGFVWGRGALDDKSAVVAMLEASNTLLARGFTPQRTVYLSFGHDEEIGGNQGAASVVQYLQEKKVQLAWSLDEGSFLLDGMFPGVDLPIASINVAEKGYLSLEVVGKGAGGHSSMPPPKTAVGVLAEAIVKLQDSPVPGGIEGLTAELLDATSRHMPFSTRLVFANQWLFGGLLEKFLVGNPGTNAMMRTTTAPTMLSASVKENVLPIEAVATVNFRLHPRDSVDDIVQYTKDLVENEFVEVRVPDRSGNSASAVASRTGPGFTAIAAAIKANMSDAVVAPGITVGGTDSRHYSKVSDAAYRFNPMVVGAGDIAGFHGTNERISIDNLVLATATYATLMESAASQ